MKKLLIIVIAVITMSFTSDKETKASYYGAKFHGKTTASGEIFDMYAMTAAHKTLPFGTKVKVTNPRNNKSVIVRINDRGPFIKGRKFDLSRAAFNKIASIDRGVLTIKYRIIPNN